MKHFIDAGLSLLPEKMNTSEARAMLIAIGLQESKFEHRKQIQGPALGFWQFERAGILGVLAHSASKFYLIEACGVLKIEPFNEIFEAVRWNDALACILARLLLWTFPDPLPDEGEVNKSWNQYLKTWRPGKPHRETWDNFFNRGWELTLQERIN